MSFVIEEFQDHREHDHGEQSGRDKDLAEPRPFLEHAKLSPHPLTKITNEHKGHNRHDIIKH